MTHFKMTFKKIKPFVMELVTFLFVVGGILGGLLAENFIEITFRANILTIAAFLLFLFGGLMLFSRVVTTGIRALIDFIFQRIKEDDYVFLEERPYVATVFTEKVPIKSSR